MGNFNLAPEKEYQLKNPTALKNFNISYRNNHVTIKQLNQYYIKILSEKDYIKLKQHNHHITTNFIICLHESIDKNIDHIYYHRNTIMYIPNLELKCFLNHKYDNIWVELLDYPYNRCITYDDQFIDTIFKIFVFDFIKKKLLLNNFVDLNEDVVTVIFKLLIQSKYIL